VVVQDSIDCHVVWLKAGDLMSLTKGEFISGENTNFDIDILLIYESIYFLEISFLVIANLQYILAMHHCKTQEVLQGLTADLKNLGGPNYLIRHVSGRNSTLNHFLW